MLEICNAFFNGKGITKTNLSFCLYLGLEKREKMLSMGDMAMGFVYGEAKNVNKFRKE